MGIFKKDIAKDISNVIDSVTDFADKTFTSKEEKGEIFIKLDEAKNELLRLVETNVTERHSNDMKSDNKLSKNVRPLTLLLLVLTLLIIIALKAFMNVSVPLEYTEILKYWGGLAMSFYFGGRTIEKLPMIASSVHSLFNKKRGR